MIFRFLLLAILIASVVCYYLTPFIKKAIFGDRKISKNIEIFLIGIFVTCSSVVFYYLLTFFMGLIFLILLIIASAICLVI